MHPRLSLVVALATANLGSSLDNGFRLPGLFWSSWNHFQGSISDALLRECADAMVASGLRDAGYLGINLDDGWAHNRSADGTINPDPALFPQGMKPVVDYVHSKGLTFGIYTARGSTTCMGRPGSDSYEAQDASVSASLRACRASSDAAAALVMINCLDARRDEQRSLSGLVVAAAGSGGGGGGGGSVSLSLWVAQSPSRLDLSDADARRGHAGDACAVAAASDVAARRAPRRPLRRVARCVLTGRSLPRPDGQHGGRASRPCRARCACRVGTERLPRRPHAAL
jgi:hypothetical protein